MAIVRGADRAELALARAGEETRGTALSRYLRRWLPIGIGILLAVAMIVVAAAPPLLAPLSPSAQFSGAVLKAPGAVARPLLGTDEFAPDLLSRITRGARLSLQAGLASA